VKTCLQSLLFGLLLVGAWPVEAQSSAPCTITSVLTNDEAKVLLYVTPAAVSARREGTDVDIEKSEPTDQYPASNFFAAALVSKRPVKDSGLGNGILGYFVVDKRTGQVESMDDFTTVKGKELDRVRTWLLHAHCGAQ